jgi:hypothetical protein
MSEMLRTTTAISCLIVLGLAAGAAEKPDPQAGYAILDGFVGMFQNMAQTGQGGYDAVDKALQAVMADVKKARAEGKIDAIFTARMTRLLAVVRLVVQPDPEIILKPYIDREVSFFIREITGEEVREGDKRGIGAIALALAHEIINLRIYLETLPRRAELMRNLEKGLGLNGK